MRGAFVAGLFAGVALGALVVLAAQEQNRKVIVVQAGRLADQARSMLNNGTTQARNMLTNSANQAMEAASDVVTTVATNVAEVATDVATSMS